MIACTLRNASSTAFKKHNNTMDDERLAGNSERQLLLRITLVAQTGIKLFRDPCGKRARATCWTSCRPSLQETTAAATQQHSTTATTAT